MGVTQEVVNIVIGVLMAIFLYFIAGLIGRLTVIFNQKLLKAKQEAQAAGQTAKAAAFQFAITVLQAVTYTVVSQIEAEKAYRIRQAVKAGEAKAEDLKILSSEAYNAIVQQLSAEIKDCLDDTVDNTEAFIREKIEEILPKVKADYLKSLAGEGETNGDAAEKVED